MMFIRKSLFLAALTLVFISCSKETTSPEKFGDIKGKVMQTETNKKLSGVSISTTPATNSILTSKNGSFNLQEVPTGSYTVEAEKEGFSRKTVDIEVREERTATAKIFLKKDNVKITAKNIEAEVTSLSERMINSDSTYAEADYKVLNTSEEQKSESYQVLFEIETSGPSFFFDTKDSSLAAGEYKIGSFEKYIRGNSVEAITVKDIVILPD